MSLCLSSETQGQNPHRIPLRSVALLSAGCSGTMTSILPDISGDITIFVKKDISGGDGFGPVFLSRSNKVSLIFGYCGTEVARLEMSWRIAIFTTAIFTMDFSHLVIFRTTDCVCYWRIQSKCIICWGRPCQKMFL